jgi:hypothetical protein
MSRGPRFMTAKDPGLNSILRISCIAQNLDIISLDEDEVHWSSIDCMAIII